MKKYAALIKTIRKADGEVGYQMWGNWNNRKAAIEVLENLKAAYERAYEIIEEKALPEKEARAIMDDFYAL